MILFPSRVGFEKTGEGLLFYEGQMLKDIQINTKNIDVEFPRFKSWKLQMCYVPREELTAIRNDAASMAFNTISRQKEEKVDTDKFMDVYVRKAVKGWTGLTYEMVMKLVPVELDESDLTKEIPYSHEDAMWLVKNSSEFDTFISETMNQVDLFSVTRKADQLKK